MQTARKIDGGAQALPAAVPVSRDVYDLAGKAFSLIEKYQTPPDPNTYSIWYAYAAGADSDLVAKVDGLLADKGNLSRFDIETLYEEHSVKANAEAARQAIGTSMQEEIESVLKMVQASLRHSDSFSTTLDEAGARLPKAASAADLAAMLSGLVDENRRMAQTTRELHQGLVDSQRQIETLNKELEEVQHQSLRDPLTAVSNRRAFDVCLEEETRKATASGEALCLAIADIDYFKRVNDTFGHQVGDAVLQMFASIIEKNIKGQDMVARIGGEEFAIILPRTDVLSAYNLLIKIKSSFKEAELMCTRTNRIVKQQTASFGIARFQPGMTPAGLIEQADTYLYAAKNEGRDRVKAKGF
ncbi:MAG: GGDEF domain-containing protein [Hyphomonas sp.]|nr:GGDEF domain-containing protein [Hyphomonas sp.]